MSTITPFHSRPNTIDDSMCDSTCQGYATSFVDTLDRICNTKELYDMFSFMTDDQQQKLFEYLKDKDPELYAGLDTT